LPKVAEQAGVNRLRETAKRATPVEPGSHVNSGQITTSAEAFAAWES
jgi:hypothetical protein